MTDPYRTAPPVDLADMTSVPDADIPLMKARAIAAGVNDSLIAHKVDGIDREYVFRTPTVAEWNDYLDWANDPQRSSVGEWNLVVSCLMWPNETALRFDSEEQPGIVRKFVNVIEEHCGAGQSHTTDLTLAVSLTDDKFARFGLEREDVLPLLAQYQRKGQLRAINIRVSPLTDEAPESVSVIIKAPTRNVYDTMMTGFKSADKALAVYNAAMSCIVWPQDKAEVRDLVKARPGIPWSLFVHMAEMGGLLLKGETRKL